MSVLRALIIFRCDYKFAALYKGDVCLFLFLIPGGVRLTSASVYHSVSCGIRNKNERKQGKYTVRKVV